MATLWVLLSAVLVLSIHMCMASHFRGAIIQWQPTGNSNEVEISYRQSWRRSFDTWTYCDQDTIDREDILGSGSLTCPTCSNQNVCPFTFACTDFSVGEDWTTGVGSCDYGIERTSFTVQYTGCCWIGSINNGGGGGWSIEAWVNLAPRPDNGALNTSPITSMQPIYRTKFSCPYVIRIPTSDADGDNVRCRWPATLAESGDLTQPLDMELDPDECTLSFTATGLGWWGVAVIIEDFTDPTSNTALSKIPLQFLIEVAENTDPCETAYEPVLVDPSPKDDQCIGIPLGTTYTTEIRAKSNTAGVSITQIDTVSPLHMHKSPVSPVPGFDDEFYVDITWTPASNQQGPNIFCFAAVDALGQSSEQRCITLLVGGSGPIINLDKAIPVNNAVVPEDQHSWKLVFDQEFIVAHDTAYIRFFDAHDHPIFFLDVATSPYVYPNNRSLTFYTNGIVLKPGQHYYILVDEGIVMGTGVCSPESPAIHVPWEYTFSVEAPTPAPNATLPQSTSPAGPVVTTQAPPVPIRLVGGEHEWEGRVEVYYAGLWGTVCDDGFSDEEANVVCRQLGYHSANMTAYCCAHYGQGAGMIWMDDLYCDGDERDLGQCPRRGWGDHNCDHSEDASVRCAPVGPPTIVDCNGMVMTVYIPLETIGDNEADHIHWLDESCVGTHHNNTHVLISTPFNQCGTTMEVRDDYVVFSNVVIDEPLPVTPGNIITRDRHIEIPVECKIDKESLSSVSFNPDSSKIVFREEGYGVFSFNLSLYEDQTYKTHYPRSSYPIDVQLRDMLYFEAAVEAEQGLELFVETCMATTDTSPTSHPQYAFLHDGCSKDTTFQRYSANDPMVERFGLEAFAFVGLHGPVYVHCYMMLCNTSDSSSRCSQGCLSPIAKRAAASGSKPYLMTQGPISLPEQEHFHHANQDEETHESSVSVSDMNIMLGTVAFAALCLMVTVGVITKVRRNTGGYVAVATVEDIE